jgi:hypothetical protein
MAEENATMGGEVDTAAFEFD